MGKKLKLMLNLLVLTLILVGCVPISTGSQAPTRVQRLPAPGASPIPSPRPVAPRPPDATITPQRDEAPDMPGSSGEVRAERLMVIGGQPAMRLSDGQTVLLQPAEDQRIPCMVPLCPREPDEPIDRPPFRICSRPPYPASVNLQANQTAIRNQGGRNTCTVFAITAALEAAYRRQYGVALDLSEQYMNHVQKSHWLNWRALTPLVEIQPETNGGGNIPWHAAVFERYGEPEESVLPYIDTGDYENTNQPGDQPLGLDSQSLTQRALDDFNLSSTLSSYAIPGPLSTIILPQAALERARYRPTQTVFAGASDLWRLDWYRSHLACGHEVPFDFAIPGGSTWNANNVWVPGTGNVIGAHAMVMVGYDDARDAFLVKNSWGGTALNWFSYDWVRQGHLESGAVILDVVSPGSAFGVWENPQLFLGRWNLDHDGWRGILDIYRLPRPLGNASPDLRVGTYFGPDGVARRVNATIAGNHIEFTIDWNNPDQPFDLMQGLRFSGYIFSWNHGIMAGTMLDNRDGNTYGFHAQKATPWTGRPVPNPLDLDTFVGVWSMNHDGWRGILTIRSVNPASRSIDATYQSSDGRQYLVSGHIDQDPRRFTMAISFGNPAQQFNGLLYGREHGMAAGTTTWAGTPYGFVMVRTGEVAPVGPDPTEDPDRGPRVCQKKPYLPQCQ